MQALRGRFTYANVVATLALFLALSGGVVLAADKIGSNDIAKNAIKSKHVKKNALTGADVNESKLGEVPSAHSALSAVTAGRATSANPEAFAHILADGSVDGANSKGISQANVTFDGGSTSCIHGLGFTPRGGQVTDDYNGGHLDTGLQLGLGDIGGCPAGTQAFVYTFAESNGAGQPTNFFVALYR